MSDEALTIEIDAYLPPVKSAILIGGTGDDMQIKLEVALRQSPGALRMASMTGRRLHIVVTELPDLKPGENYTELHNETTEETTGSPYSVGGRRRSIRRDK